MLEEIAAPHFRNSLKGIDADSVIFANGGNEEELERQLELNCLASLSGLPTFAMSGKTLLGPFGTPAVSCKLFRRVTLESFM